MPIPLKAGEILRERYQIIRIIGQGGMGSIYLAADLRLEGRQCALKEVEHDRSLAQDLVKESRDQFFREATVLARLDHPNLPKVSDYFSIENRDYLVMDYIPGKDLRTLMTEAMQNKIFLEEEEVLAWSVQLADALTFLHNQNPPILHRDIKPSNLKVTPSGVLKLVDFGLVKLLAKGEVTITILQGQGTALYTPLEQYGGDGSHTDARSDLYAFGSTLYHLLTNRPPPEARERFLDPDILTPPRQINPKISNRVERSILLAMALHPDDRPATVADFEEMLVGSRNPGVRRKTTPVRPLTIQSVLGLLPEKYLFYSVIGLMLVSLILTIII